MLLWCFLNLKSKIKQKNLHLHYQMSYCLLLLKILPASSFHHAPCFSGSFCSICFLGIWPLPSAFSWPNPGVWEPFFTPSSLPPWESDPYPAHLHSCWHGLSWILPGLFQWFLCFPCSLSLGPSTVQLMIFPESSSSSHFPVHLSSGAPPGGQGGVHTLWASPTWVICPGIRQSGRCHCLMLFPHAYSLILECPSLLACSSPTLL